MQRALTSDAYRPRRPQDSILFQVLNEHLSHFLGLLEDSSGSYHLPRFVKREFEKFLTCGFHEYGLTRIGCKNTDCGEDYWIPTSCKCRGFCPSCGGRRMNQFAINLDERIIPYVPVRQYVVSVPIPLRLWMVKDHALTLEIHRLIIRAIRALLRKKARRIGVPEGTMGAVTFIQRFGSALNCHPHFHILVLDGVFEVPDAALTKGPSFVDTPALNQDDVSDLIRKICRKVTQYLTKNGYIEEVTLEPLPASEEASSDEPDLLSACKQASVSHRIAFGVRAGHRVRRLGRNQFGYGEGGLTVSAPLTAQYRGFSLHAATRIHDGDRERLRNLVSHASRPSISHDRLSLTESGDIRVALKTPWADGTRAIILSPFELIEKLAALVPYPQKNLVIYSGCLAPKHPLRHWVVPVSSPHKENSAEEARAEEFSGAREEASHQPPDPRYIPWAELLKRTWALDVFTCRNCGGPTHVKAFIYDPFQIKKIMDAIHLEPRPPPGRSIHFHLTRALAV